MPLPRLDKLCDIERPIRDPDNQEILRWERWRGDRWCKIETLSGRELMYARQAAALATHRVTFRFFEELTPDMRINYRGRLFNIESIVDPDEAHRELIVMCVERVN